jgi:hypothetical protein
LIFTGIAFGRKAQMAYELPMDRIENCTKIRAPRTYPCAPLPSSKDNCLFPDLNPATLRSFPGNDFAVFTIKKEYGLMTAYLLLKVFLNSPMGKDIK